MTGEILSVEPLVWICLWQSTIFVAAGLAGSFLLRRRSSRAHQILLLSIIAAVVAPAISTIVKHSELGLFVAEPVAAQSQLETEDFSLPGFVAQGIEYEAGSVDVALTPVTTVPQSPPLPWARIAFYGWAAASLILAMRLIATFLLGIRLLGRAERLACEKMDEAMRSALASLGIGKGVEVHSSQRVRSPAIWCWKRRPVLLVPGETGHFDNNID